MMKFLFLNYTWYQKLQNNFQNDVFLRFNQKFIS